MAARVTNKQRKLAEYIVQNAQLDAPLNKGEMLVKAGYDKTTAVATPTRVIEAEGVQIALAELGFTEDNAKGVVAEILLNPDADDGHRLKAAAEVFKVKGSYAAEKTIGLQVNVEARLDGNDAESLRLEFEEKLKQKLLG